MKTQLETPKQIRRSEIPPTKRCIWYFAFLCSLIIGNGPDACAELVRSGNYRIDHGYGI